MKILSLFLGVSTLLLTGCGQQYDLQSGQQSALVDSSIHLEAGANEIVPTTESTPTPTPSVAPTPSDPISAHSCGKKADKKIYICHRPPGNPDNEHTLCIAIQGAIHGHGILLDGSPTTTGDYLGKCAADQ